MTEDASSESLPKSAAISTRTRWIILLILLVVTIGGTLGYWQYRVYYPTTEDAYVGSYIVRVAPEVNGVVSHVYVSTDEHVNSDDPLFDLDATLYDAALRAAQAQFDAAADASGTAADDLKKAADTLNQKREALDPALAAYRKAKDAQKVGQPPSQALTQAEKTWQDALAAYRKAEADFVAAQKKNIAITTPTVKLRGAAAQLQKAMHDVVKTHVTAPASGNVSTVDIRPGSALQAGHPVFAIIEGQHWWVDANFKETDVARIRRGQKATISLDMYPGVTFHGTVDSVSSGSGATFSVLPPENATGNWVKVTQRFPVRVTIDNPDAAKDKPLRVGASASVTVNTSSGQASADSGDANATSQSAQ